MRISPKGVQVRKSGKPISIGWPLVLVVALIAQSIGMSGQSSDPSTLPLVGLNDLQYLGGFRVPAEAANGKYFSYGGKGMAYNPATNGLFLAAGGNVAEISIPSPVNSSDVNALPVATYLQPFADPAEGHMGDLPGGGTLDNLMVYSNRLYVTGLVYYDANNMQRQSHFARSLNLSQSSFSGWSSVWQADKSGFVSGMMSPVPTEWQAKLGGPAVTGQCCVPIVTRTSFGPAAIAFDPTQVGLPSVPGTPLLYYPSSNPTLGSWSGSNPTYGGTTLMGGMVIIAGTRTALYFGSNGVGQNCYGTGVTDPALHDPARELCYDPTAPEKGSHAYPYRYQVWAYDLNDFAAVKAGTKQPWEVRPYGVWVINFPIPELKVRIGGVAYDSQRQLIYVSQMRADQRGFGYMPLIHAFKVGSATGALPPTSNTVGSLSLRADKAAPQAARTPITFTATPTGGTAPYAYSWWINDGTAWTLAQDWTSSPQFVWTPTVVNPSFQVGARVRSSGNTANVPEATAMMPFPIGAATTAKATAVVLTANRNAPQAPFTPITWTAAPVGGTGHEFKWLVSDGSNWTVLSNWSKTATFVWTPSTVNPNYKVSVWVRSTGNTADAAEASAEQAFRIEAAVPPSASTPTTPDGSASARVSSVNLTANKQAPQAPGTPIVWSATPAGGIAPHQYKWWVYDGANWNVVSNWSGAASYTWTPSAANPRYRVAVWVRSAGNTNDYHEASAEHGFAIESPGAVSAPTLAVRLTTDKKSPQAAATTITWTAALTGGTGAYEFKWHVYDGNWNVVKTWSTSNTFSWTPKASGRYRVAVWVRSVGNTNDYWQVNAEDGFTIK